MWGSGGITIGNDVLIVSHGVITSLPHDKNAACFRETTLRAPVVIGDNVWIGAGAIILPGVIRGRRRHRCGGAVVMTRDVPANAVWRECRRGWLLSLKRLLNKDKSL